jgi:transcriptional antiterminator RfaH
VAYWSCAQLQPNRVRLALHFLELNGFATYCPRVYTEGRSLPDYLFPGYAFVSIESQWHIVRRTPGVAKLVMHDDQPARVADRVIADLRSREAADGLVHLRGDRIRITAGAFQGLTGIYQGMKSRERVEVLLALLGAERRLVLAKRDILRLP